MNSLDVYQFRIDGGVFATIAGSHKDLQEIHAGTGLLILFGENDGTPVPPGLNLIKK